ncbi:MAG: CDP-diacylglycerol--serine O-phosphatidyltransferase [Bdellovibrionaceae bacterium]|nr:CDP-diacylglycerol--serine O-phosphatidyltransferase [Pseudobdellovibrionaceae bacterium]
MRKKRRLNKINNRARRIRQRMNQQIYVLPNLLTTGNLFFGFYSMIHAIEGKFIMAAYAIVAAAVFDLLDGRVARMTKSESDFGAEYDSLCDLVSFGLAPGILLFLWSLQDFGRWGWIAAFFYVACTALRLARFNVGIEDTDKAFFQGLPSPMAAGIVASSVLAFNDLGWDPSRSRLLLGITFLLAFVMVTNFRYRSFKDLDLKRRLPFKYLVYGVFLVAIIGLNPEVNLFVLFLSYALLGAIFGILKIGRQPRGTAEGDFVDDELDQFESDDDLDENDEGYQ